MFLDMPNVTFIRDALWRHKAIGTASIMIGAGFSRNADPTSGAARPMPNWTQMAEALCDPLYPADPIRFAAAKREASGTSGFLRLAQEYQSAFGPSALSDQIRNLVPDGDYRPGVLHKRLLRLPWADVFSTNWDTLLERARDDVFEYSYDVVRTVEQIPFAARPRIVKLHGTFPAHEPFIFTEEEYRTYPARFAPFVNLVQQSMMETIFCLLGFSGDDPNFLHWSGWVRDNLGKNAPKIYLVGWLELSVHRRRMLEDRHVMPVDLSGLPQATAWPPEMRHQYATEWFLRALEAGKPADIATWPSTKPPASLPPEYLEPLPLSTAPSPRPESIALMPGLDDAVRAQGYRDAADTWSWNRKLYPGWLIPPLQIRRGLWSHTRDWLAHLAEILPSLTPFERLRVLTEISWRLDRILFPLVTNLEEAAFVALESIDRVALTVAGSKPPPEHDWSDLLRQSWGLALSLSRNARHVGDATGFQRALAFLRPFADHAREVANAIAYEECLWDLAVSDLQSLNQRLNRWVPASSEALWLLRKAGLLAETRDNERACACLEAALVQIRRTRRRDRDDIQSLSYESWALVLSLAYSGRFQMGGPELPDDMPESFQRWRELAAVECDAFGDYQNLLRILELGRQTPRDVTRRRGFDLGHEGVTFHMAGDAPRTLLAAYEMVLIAEATGIPPSTNHHQLLKEGLSAAARILADNEPFLAAQIAIRIASTDNDELLDDVFSRARVARLPHQAVSLLRDGMLKRVAFGLSGLAVSAAGERDWQGLVGVSLEVLSRVVLRLPESQLRPLFDEAVAYYRSEVFRRASMFLGRPLSRLLMRILEALPPSAIESLLPVLFGLPLPQEGDQQADPFNWVDALRLLPPALRYNANSNIRRDPAWDTIIARLIAASAGSNIENRKAALLRVHRLWAWQLLTPSETLQFAQALWSPAHLGPHGLPSNTDFNPWVFLILPEAESGQGKRAITQLIVYESERTDGNLFERLNVIGTLLAQAAQRGITLALPDTILTSWTGLLGAWAATRLSNRTMSLFLNQEDRLEYGALVGVRALMQRITIAPALERAIWAKVDDLDERRDHNVRAYPLYPELSRLFPGKKSLLIDRLRRSLVSDNSDDARMGVMAISTWVHDAMGSPQQFDMPDSELIHEIGIAIAARRLTILKVALDFARWLFRRGPDDWKALLASDCAHGLAALFEEATYARQDVPFDVPGMRAACMRLARSMNEAGYGESEAVRRWLQAAKDDPLPELRYDIAEDPDE